MTGVLYSIAQLSYKRILPKKFLRKCIILSDSNMKGFLSIFNFPTVLTISYSLYRML